MNSDKPIDFKISIYPQLIPIPDVSLSARVIRPDNCVVAYEEHVSRYHLLEARYSRMNVEEIIASRMAEHICRDLYEQIKGVLKQQIIDSYELEM